MALVRCECHDPDPEKTHYDYVMKVEPIGYPNDAVICGRRNCRKRGLVWLSKEEASAYNNKNARIFSSRSGGEAGAAKIRVK